jgi:hypothetical protein
VLRVVPPVIEKQVTISKIEFVELADIGHTITILVL